MNKPVKIDTLAHLVVSFTNKSGREFPRSYRLGEDGFRGIRYMGERPFSVHFEVVGDLRDRLVTDDRYKQLLEEDIRRTLPNVMVAGSSYNADVASFLVKALPSKETQWKQ